MITISILTVNDFDDGQHQCYIHALPNPDG